MASLRARAAPLARSSLRPYLCGNSPLPRSSTYCSITAEQPILRASLGGLHKTTLPTSSYCPSRAYASSESQTPGPSPTSSAEPTTETKAQSIPDSPRTSLSSLSRALGLGDSAQGRAPRSIEEYSSSYQPSGEHHLHVYAHKHNMHITLAAPPYLDQPTQKMRQKVLLTLSTGNIGYKKAARGTYEAGFQLGSYFLSRIQLDGIIHKIQRLEITLRGFGAGREAVIKLLLGQEGAALRDRVIRVTDASRVKMGGQRAPKPRRLG